MTYTPRPGAAPPSWHGEVGERVAGLSRPRKGPVVSSTARRGKARGRGDRGNPICPGHPFHFSRQCSAWLGTVWRGRARQGKGPGGRSDPPAPAIHFTFRQGAAGRGVARHGQAVLGSARGWGVGQPTAPANPSHCSSGHGRAGLGMARLGGAWHGGARQGAGGTGRPARPGHPSLFIDPAGPGSVGLGRAWHGTAGLGKARGWGVGQPTAPAIPSHCRSGRGKARLGWVGHGWAGQGKGLGGRATDRPGQPSLLIDLGWARLGQAGSGQAGLGRARCGRARQGAGGTGRPARPGHPFTLQILARHGWDRLGRVRHGMARQGKGPGGRATDRPGRLP
jgi:hypothetical protein